MWVLVIGVAIGQNIGAYMQLSFGKQDTVATFQKSELPKTLNDFVFGIADLDGPIPANRFADSRESPDSRESFQGSRTEPLLCESRFGALEIVSRRFEVIRANRSNVTKINFIDSRAIAPIRAANRQAI